MADTVLNKSGVSVEFCDDPMVVLSNDVEVTELALILTKSANCAYFVTGGTITYCTTINNASDLEIEDSKWFDNLNPRLTYIEDSFLVDGVAAVPTIDGQELSYNISSLLPNQSMVICFKVLVGAPIPVPDPIPD